MAFFGLLGRSRYERRGFELYNGAVAAARSPYFYAELGCRTRWMAGSTWWACMHVC